ncbi:MAG: DnaJ domain-containing protein [Pseudomonadota bacterium]
MAKLLLLGLLLYGGWILLRRSAPALTIDEKEARAILGVDNLADAEAIRAAHRRLVSAVHPDRGGSAELARRINAARDVLLKRRH